MASPELEEGSDAALSERQRVLSSLRIKLSLSLMVASIVLVLSCVIWFAVSAIFAQLTPRTRADLIWKTESGVAELRRATDLGVVTSDAQRVAQAARRYVEDSDVLGIIVSKADGQLLFQHGVSPLPAQQLLSKPPDQAIFEEGYLASWSRIDIEDVQVGTVALFISMERLKAGVELRRRILAVATLGSVLALLAALTFVNRRVMPVLRVTEAAFAELEEKSEAALESARIKGQFLANMSHEIRTPLNGIVGIVGLLRELRLDGSVHRYVEVLDASARSLMTIVNDILDFSKIEAGKLALRKELVSPGQLAQEVIELLGERAYAKGLELSFRSEANVPKAFVTDGDRFRQVLTNLIVNAIKFTERGRVAIRLQIEGAGALAFLKVVVEDTGVGISEQDQARLFQAFSQVDGSSVRNQGGTGLGLAISRRLVGALGGQLALTSTPGAGSRFWFTLPLEGPEYGTPEQPLVSHRVLIVSDSEDLRESVREYLERWGMLGIPEASGLEALDRLQQPAPPEERAHAVILAQSSSDIGAREFLELQSASPLLRDLPVLILRDPGVPLETGALPACVRAEVSKPIRSSELYDALARLFAPRARASEAPPSSAARETSGLRILIVDDNEINRFVALRQVERLGYEGVTACNGEEAVQAVTGGDFAAVLMDCQMPVMDGYEATREIRRREAGQRHTPIVALTAHALAKERDKCLAAGMDGYLTKPARLDALRSVLARWTLPQRSGESGMLRAVSQPPRALLEPLRAEPESSPEQIATAPALVDEERPVRLLELFLERTPPLIEALAVAIESANAKDAHAHAHKLKGSCMAVGARRMALMAEQIQHAAELADCKAAARPLPLLIEQWSEVSELLQKERQAALAGSAS